LDINVRIAGEAGQGVETIGTLTVDALAGMGLCVFATRSYMSRIRGGLNAYDIRIGDRELFSRRDDADVLVALTQQALARGEGHRLGRCTAAVLLWRDSRCRIAPKTRGEPRRNRGIHHCHFADGRGQHSGVAKTRSGRWVSRELDFFDSR